MGNKNVTVEYDGDRIDALDVFLKLKDSYLEVEITRQLDALYTKNVPASVRDFIKRKTDMQNPSKEE